MVDERVCKCTHLTLSHEHMVDSIQDMIAGLVKAGTLIPQYYPGKVLATEFLLKDTKSEPVSYDQIVDVLDRIRATQSRCHECYCEMFVADNLLYLERLSERKASKTAH
jgi:hypothetical protein